ncbi:MAG: hypothetical protein QXN57_03210 [Desulfurococcaceae archaeon]
MAKARRGRKGRRKKASKTTYSKKRVRKVQSKKRVKRPVVLRAVNWQRGKSKWWIDDDRDALAPGKRRSKNGKIYYEYRKNRSDLPGKRI